MSARALTTSVGTGSAFAVALRLLDRLEQPATYHPLPDPYPVCAAITRDTTGWHLQSVILGLVLGALLFPICELILGHRCWLLCTLLEHTRIGSTERPRVLHRFLDSASVYGRSNLSTSARTA